MQLIDLEYNNIPYNRLVWACRRGMLELDLLLNKFLKGAYEGLEDADKALFARLLGCQDPELFQWLLGSEVPVDPDLASMVKRIREYARADV